MTLSPATAMTRTGTASRPGKVKLQPDSEFVAVIWKVSRTLSLPSRNVFMDHVPAMSWRLKAGGAGGAAAASVAGLSALAHAAIRSIGIKRDTVLIGHLRTGGTSVAGQAVASYGMGREEANRGAGIRSFPPPRDPREMAPSPPCRPGQRSLRGRWRAPRPPVPVLPGSTGR